MYIIANLLHSVASTPWIHRFITIKTNMVEPVSDALDERAALCAVWTNGIARRGAKSKRRPHTELNQSPSFLGNHTATTRLRAGRLYCCTARREKKNKSLWTCFTALSPSLTVTISILSIPLPPSCTKLRTDFMRLPFVTVEFVKSVARAVSPPRLCFRCHLTIWR